MFIGAEHSSGAYRGGKEETWFSSAHSKDCLCLLQQGSSTVCFFSSSFSENKS